MGSCALFLGLSETNISDIRLEYSSRIDSSDIMFYVEFAMFQFAWFYTVSKMKTAKGKDKAKTTKEALKPVDDRKVGKRKAPAETRKEKKAKKDPNKPKRAPSAFFVFLEDFRTTFKKDNPNVKAVSAEKAPYEEKAAKRKAEYEKLMDAYNKNLEEGSDESEKSRSEVNDEDEASEEVTIPINNADFIRYPLCFAVEL
ncbi:hypothetical protein DY000_02026515 [Brassica cretica]|uniref:HMG box domain-containing protein n=1 Tax=Brassica cretica TaxID=69181 RepID=A0ABQ7EIM4_BRACR|nr:hypothetical protein DY000_02026515 [Brassica cretica]